MNEIIFLIEEAFFTEANTLDELQDMLLDAVSCHFEKEKVIFKLFG